jgi:hypothetical protein
MNEEQEIEKLAGIIEDSWKVAIRWSDMAKDLLKAGYRQQLKAESCIKCGRNLQPIQQLDYTDSPGGKVCIPCSQK